MKKLYELHWDILKAADMVLKLPEKMKTPSALLDRIYTGNARRLIHTPVARLWSVTTVTRAKSLDGEIHTLRTTFKPDAPLFLSELTETITPRWLAYADEDLANMDVIDAIATARCLI